MEHAGERKPVSAAAMDDPRGESLLAMSSALGYGQGKEKQGRRVFYSLPPEDPEGGSLCDQRPQCYGLKESQPPELVQHDLPIEGYLCEKELSGDRGWGPYTHQHGNGSVRGVLGKGQALEEQPTW